MALVFSPAIVNGYSIGESPPREISNIMMIWGSWRQSRDTMAESWWLVNQGVASRYGYRLMGMIWPDCAGGGFPP